MTPFLKLLAAFLVLASGLMGAPPTHAAENIPAVQLSPFTVPGHRKSGTRQMMPVTLYLELHQASQIEPVCRLAPRLVERSLSVFGGARLKIVRGKLELGQIDQTLLTSLNSFFPDAPIYKVHIVQSFKSIGTGAGRQLGKALGCSRVPDFDPKMLP